MFFQLRMSLNVNCKVKLNKSKIAQNMTRKIIVALIGIIMIVAALFWTINTIAGNKPPKRKPKPALVKYAETKKVQYADYPAMIETTGRLNSFNKTSIISEVQGNYISSKKLFKVGEKFRKGETLLKIDDRQILLELKSSKSNFLSIISSILPDIKNDYPESYNTWEDYLNRISVEKPIPDLPEIENKIKLFLTSRNVIRTFYDIKNLELRHSKHTIEAPFNCIVTSSNINAGALIIPGQNLGMISQVGSFELELSVTNYESNMIGIGDKVEASDGMNWQGRIIRKSDFIDQATQSVKVFARVTGSELKDGMYLNARISGKSLDDVFKINRNAIVNSSSLYYLDTADKLQQKMVEIVLQNKEDAFIRGIDSNTKVLTGQITNVALGTKIISIDK